MVSEQARDSASTAILLYSIGITYRRVKEYERSVVHIERSLHMERALGRRNKIANCFVGLGNTYRKMGDIEAIRAPQKALGLFEQALAHYATVNSPTRKAYLLLRLGSVELRMERTTDADAHLRSGALLAQRSGDDHLEMEYELVLSELASVQGDAASTFEHMQRYLVLKDSLQGADTERELARLRTAFDTERKEKDNALLRAVSNEQDERLQRNRV